MGSESVNDESPERRFRTLFISDVHLGARGSQAHLLLDFLRYHDADTIYLVGDIVDGWALKLNWYWPQSHNDFVQKMLRKARKGAKVIYIPGNHDEIFRDYVGMEFGNVSIQKDAIHVTADGKRLLVLHGDEFDSVMQVSKWLAKLGSRVYDWLLYCNRWVNVFRRKLGFPYWSLAAYLKHKAKSAVQFIGDYEEAVAKETLKRGADGVVCGHIHHAEITRHHGVLYCNDGDWVESCTALIERHDGTLEILNWAEHIAARDAQKTAAPSRKPTAVPA